MKVPSSPEAYRNQMVKKISEAPLVSESLRVVFYNYTQLSTTLPIPQIVSDKFQALLEAFVDHFLSNIGEVQVDLDSPTFKPDLAQVAEDLYISDFLDNGGALGEQIDMFKSSMDFSPRKDDRMWRVDMGRLLSHMVQSAILIEKSVNPDVIRFTPEERAKRQSEMMLEFSRDGVQVDVVDSDVDEIAGDIVDEVEKIQKDKLH